MDKDETLAHWEKIKKEAEKRKDEAENEAEKRKVTITGVWNEWAEDLLKEKEKLEKNGEWREYERSWADWCQGADVDFSNYEFDNDANFEGFIFPYRAEFGGATFKGEAKFSGAEFRGEAWFNNVKFEKMACFKGTVFSNKAIFSEDKEDARTVFKYCAFFNEAKFKGDVNFSHAVFSQLVKFQGATFSKYSRFEHVTFQACVTFAGADILEYIDFHDSTFSKNANFNKTNFIDYASFEGAKFKGKTQFYGTKFDGIFSLDNAEFKEVPDFLQARFRGLLRLDNVKINPPDENNEDRSKRYREIAARYRVLKKMAIESHDHIRELEFFAAELKARLEIGDANDKAVNFFGRAYELFADFGQSLARPFWWWLASVLVFWEIYFAIAIHYPSVGSLHNYLSALFGKSIYLSFLNSLPIIGFGGGGRDRTLRYLFGAPEDMSLWLDALFIIQNLWSAILIFLFLLALRNHFKIK